MDKRTVEAMRGVLNVRKATRVRGGYLVTLPTICVEVLFTPAEGEYYCQMDVLEDRIVLQRLPKIEISEVEDDAATS